MEQRQKRDMEEGEPPAPLERSNSSENMGLSPGRRASLVAELDAKIDEASLDAETTDMLKEYARHSGMEMKQLDDMIDNLVHGGNPEDAGAKAAPATAAEAPSRKEEGPPPTECEVWIVRHGERLDEVPGNQWYKEAEKTGAAWFDPPLTAKGQKQAAGAASALQEMLSKRGAIDIPFDVVYSSPLQRCVATAAPFAEAFGIPIQMIPGLGECCAALRGCMDEGSRWIAAREKWPDFKAKLLPRDRLEAACPGVRFVEDDPTVDPYLSDAQGRKSCVGRLAEGKRRILVVTHREGIRDLAKVAGKDHRRTPYCCIARFIKAHGKKGGSEGWRFEGLQ